jgi:hypothetical protein
MLSRRIWYRNRELLRQLSNLGARVTSLIKPIEALGPKLSNAHATSKYLEENVSQEETNEKLLTSNSSIRKDLSRGSFFIDNDGNQILDLAMDKGTMPLGYNSKVLMESLYSKVQDILWNDSRYSFGDAHTDFEDFLRGSILPAAPKGLTEVRFTDGTGSRANEAAIKVALLKFKETQGWTGKILHLKIYLEALIHFVVKYVFLDSTMVEKMKVLIVLYLSLMIGQLLTSQKSNIQCAPMTTITKEKSIGLSQKLWILLLVVEIMVVQ